MRRPHLLLALLLPVACAQVPDASSDATQVLQAVLAEHQANLTGIGGRPVAAPMEGTEEHKR